MKRLVECVCVVFFSLQVCAGTVESNEMDNAIEKRGVNNVVAAKMDAFSKGEADWFDLVARKISGAYIEDDHRYDNNRISYSLSIEKAWNNLYDGCLSKIPEWTDRHITPFAGCFDTVFYPFGGPDIAYALSFFPKAARYILVGLEPLGNFEKIERSLSSFRTYESIYTAFSTYLKKGYFVTSEMVDHLSNEGDVGIGGLSLVLLGISRMGYSVTQVRSCGINSEGNIVESGVGNIDCVEILCEKGLQRKSVYYIRSNLNNANPRLCGLTRFLRNFEFVTFIKSASYALHDKTFSKIRNFILKETNCLLQDDTGVPFSFFIKDWDIHIFGKYKKPALRVFRAYKQKSLERYYGEHEAQPIPFPIGYGYFKKNPNLIFAVSKNKKTINKGGKNEQN